jgi:hypothetical protein
VQCAVQVGQAKWRLQEQEAVGDPARQRWFFGGKLLGREGARRQCTFMEIRLLRVFLLLFYLWHQIYHFKNDPSRHLITSQENQLFPLAAI